MKTIDEEEEAPKEAPKKTEDGDIHFSLEDIPEGPPLMGLVGDLTEESSQQLAMSLLTLNGGSVLSTPEDIEDPTDIEFFISSGGGSVNDMFAVYDLMQLVKKNRDIATFGYGKIASAAVPLLAAGTKGKRYVGKHARLMLHHCATNASGPHPNIRSSFDELKKVEDMMVEVLAADTKLSVGEIYNMISRNTDEYFSAQEALEMGIVDKII
tara:strand:+ start:2525 stop:3157 length:633 start_codon:yes stop_codon:yes gene_type:complete